MSKEAKVGLVAIIAMFAVLVISPGQHKRPAVLGQSFNLIFTAIEGVHVGDPVKVGGVPAGVITDIEFASEEEQRMFGAVVGDRVLIRVTVAMERSVRIPENSSYEAVSNLNGYRWINITLGSGDTYLTPGDSYLGRTSSQSQDQLSATLTAFRTLSHETTELRDAIADAEFRTKVKDTASNLRFYSRELRATSESLAGEDGLLEQFEKQVDEQEQAIHHRLEAWDAKIEHVHRRVVTLTPQVKEKLTDWNRRVQQGQNQLAEVLGKAVEYSDEFEAAVQEFEEKCADPETLNKLTDQVRRASRKLDDIAAIASDLHAISSDPEVQRELKAMVDNLRERSAKLKATVEKFEQNLDKLPF